VLLVVAAMLLVAPNLVATLIGIALVLPVFARQMLAAPRTA
jgi:UPF0716 family protein affecting phage T7 exclusion